MIERNRQGSLLSEEDVSLALLPLRQEQREQERHSDWPGFFFNNEWPRPYLVTHGAQPRPD